MDREFGILSTAWSPTALRTPLRVINDVVACMELHYRTVADIHGCHNRYHTQYYNPPGKASIVATKFTAASMHGLRSTFNISGGTTSAEASVTFAGETSCS